MHLHMGMYYNVKFFLIYLNNRKCVLIIKQEVILLYFFMTFRLYNRCVLEAEWPAQASSSKLLWNKLSYVVMGAAHFKWAGKTKAARRKVSSDGGIRFCCLNIFCLKN